MTIEQVKCTLSGSYIVTLGASWITRAFQFFRFNWLLVQDTTVIRKLPIVSQKKETHIIWAQIYTCNLLFYEELICPVVAATVTAFNVGVSNKISTQFRQVNCTLSGRYTSCSLNFWRINSATQAGSVT